MEKKKQKIGGQIMSSIKQLNIQVIEIAKGIEKQGGLDKLFTEIMSYFHNLEKETIIQIQENIEPQVGMVRKGSHHDTLCSIFFESEDKRDCPKICKTEMSDHL